VPFGAVAAVATDAVRLTMSADEFKELSADYEEEYFVRVQDVEPGAPDVSDLRRIAMSIPGEPGPYLLQQATALRPDEAEITKDARVWRLKPHEKIGEVERAVFDEATGNVQSLVIRRGFVFTRDVVLPMSYVVEVVGEIVRVDIDDAALKGLAEFHETD
jgi:hypothetical protein